MAERRVVITGVGLVCAAGNSLPDFLQALAEGRSGLRHLTRFDPSRLATQTGGEVDLSRLPPPPSLPGFGQPDPITDTKLWLAWAALSQIRAQIPSDAALTAAVGLERIDLDALTATLAEAGGDPWKMPICPEIPPTRLPHLLWQGAGFTGPVSVQVNACAAGTMVLGSAFRAIRTGLADAVVAGATDSLLFPYGIHAFNSLGALSERNDLGARALAPFDKHRSGTLLGEAAAFLLLEDWDHAQKRGAEALAEILGYGASMDAWHPVMPDPTGRGAVSAMRAALADARLAPERVDYLNAHGTGTRQNDPMECRAMAEVFGPAAASLPMSSIKPFVGHLLTAAGVVEAASCLLPLQRGILPPTLHFTTPDPECPGDCIPNTAREARPQIVMTNSYGLGGQNASLLLGRMT